MKLKIGEIAKRSGVAASTIRYYVREGLLPKPEKANEKMAFYDESCVARLQVIGELQAKRYYPLYLIKNILSRIDEGLSPAEAEMIETAVFGSSSGNGGDLMGTTEFLAATGLTKGQLEQARKLGVLVPFMMEGDKPLYNRQDVAAGRDALKRLMVLGMNLEDMSFIVESGKRIVDAEMNLRRKIVAGKSTRDNVLITAELTGIGDFYRDYILRRLFQKQVEHNIQTSLAKKKAGRGKK
ncbi:MAG: MerR family transcriptional regulator [Smithellaceae bacterium]